MQEKDEPYNLLERFFLVLMQPRNKARILRWTWLISLGMLMLGCLIIYFKVVSYFGL
jgi:hypothetical protein